MTEPKPGKATSEFWLSVLGLLVVSALFYAGTIDRDTWIMFFGGLIGTYTLSRGLSKVGK